MQEGSGVVDCLRAGQRCSQCSPCTGAAATGEGGAALGCWEQGSAPVLAAEVPDEEVGGAISVTVELAYEIGLAHSL